MKRPLLYGAAGLVLAGGLGVANVAGAADKDLNSGSGSSSGSAVAGTSAGMPPTAQVRWAVVNANGSKARSFPTSVTVVREGVGIHRVDFKNNISGCAHLGTIGLSGNVGVEQPGSIEVATANVSANQVFVTTRDNAGNFADRGFHLSVQC